MPGAAAGPPLWPVTDAPENSRAAPQDHFSMPGRYWPGGWCTPRRLVQCGPSLIAHTPRTTGPTKGPIRADGRGGTTSLQSRQLISISAVSCRSIPGHDPLLDDSSDYPRPSLQTDALHLSWVNVKDAGRTTVTTLGHDAYFWSLSIFKKAGKTPPAAVSIDAQNWLVASL